MYESDFHAKKVTPSQYRGGFSRSTKQSYLNLDLGPLPSLNPEQSENLKNRIRTEAKVLLETLLPPSLHQKISDSDWLAPIFEKLGL